MDHTSGRESPSLHCIMCLPVVETLNLMLAPTSWPAHLGALVPGVWRQHRCCRQRAARPPSQRRPRKGLQVKVADLQSLPELCADIQGVIQWTVLSVCMCPPSALSLISPGSSEGSPLKIPCAVPLLGAIVISQVICNPTCQSRVGGAPRRPCDSTPVWREQIVCSDCTSLWVSGRE